MSKPTNLELLDTVALCTGHVIFWTEERRKAYEELVRRLKKREEKT